MAMNTLKQWTIADVPLEIKLKSGATGNAIEVKNSAGVVIWSVSPAGVLALPGGVVTGALSFATLVPEAVTSGSIIGTGSTWVAHSTVGSCGIKLLLSYTAATGEFASLRIRARSNSVAPVVGGNFAASAGQNDFGNLYGVQGYAQAKAAASYTQAAADNIVCGVYSVIDMAGATQSGRAWSTWIDTHTETKAAASDYLLRLSHNGTVASDGAITIYSGGRLPVLFNFEDVVGGGFLTDADASLVTQSGALKVVTPAGTKYIPLYNAP